MADDLIRDPSDYERATGEHPIIPAEPPQVQVWQRLVHGGTQFYMTDGVMGLNIYTYEETEDGDAADAMPDDVTPEQLIALGFSPCTDPVMVAGLTRMFLFTHDGRA